MKDSYRFAMRFDNLKSKSDALDWNLVVAHCFDYLTFLIF
jgi:hypothetical protein